MIRKPLSAFVSLLTLACVSQSALALTMECSNSVTETRYVGNGMPISGAPLPPSIDTTYELRLQLSALETDAPRMKGALSKTVTGSEKGIEGETIEIPVIEAGKNGVTLRVANGLTYLYSAHQRWMTAIDVAGAKALAESGKDQRLMLAVNANEIAAKSKDDLSALTQLFCKASIKASK